MTAILDPFGVFVHTGQSVISQMSLAAASLPCRTLSTSVSHIC